MLNSSISSLEWYTLHITFQQPPSHAVVENQNHHHSFSWGCIVNHSITIAWLACLGTTFQLTVSSVQVVMHALLRDWIFGQCCSLNSRHTSHIFPMISFWNSTFFFVMQMKVNPAITCQNHPKSLSQELQHCSMTISHHCLALFLTPCFGWSLRHKKPQVPHIANASPFWGNKWLLMGDLNCFWMKNFIVSFIAWAGASVKWLFVDCFKPKFGLGFMFGPGTMEPVNGWQS